jgi:beta-1,4-mannosyl-glycoprotein beta-1,4-N-acetylglucosaminyltransferase
MFNNEIELLKLRLSELQDVVDIFVIGESNQTHTGLDKPLWLQKYWDQLSSWHHKIRPIEILNMPPTGNAWTKENYQRQQLAKGIMDAQPEDWIIICDCDEIPRASTIIQLASNQDTAKWELCMPFFYYKLNYLNSTAPVWSLPVMTRKAIVKDFQQERERHQLGLSGKMAHHAGWHFSWFGDDARIHDKLKHFAHTEFDTPEVHDRVHIDTLISQGRDHLGTNNKWLPVKFEPMYWPAEISNNWSQWHNWIIPNSQARIRDFYT